VYVALPVFAVIVGIFGYWASMKVEENRVIPPVMYGPQDDPLFSSSSLAHPETVCRTQGLSVEINPWAPDLDVADAVRDIFFEMGEHSFFNSSLHRSTSKTSPCSSQIRW